MTTTTQGNAVFRMGVILHIVDVMNVISVFATNCTCVTVTLSDKLLELLIEGWRIRLKRYATLPQMGFFTAVRRSGLTRMGTVLGCVYGVLSNKICFSAPLANNIQFTSSPMWSVFTSSIFRSARIRTIKRSVRSVWMNVKNLVAIQTRFFYLRFTVLYIRNAFSIFTCTLRRTAFLTLEDLPWRKKHNTITVGTQSASFNFRSWHIVTLKGASRSASQHCYLGNAGQTGCV